MHGYSRARDQSGGMPEDRTIFDEPHYRSLESLAVQALELGHKDKAFAYADRRCRIAPPPGSQSYTLRAEALFQMGERASAIADLDQALRLAPDDIAANRRMLAWAEGARKNEAALSLIGRERDAKTLREAIEVLRAAGRQHMACVVVHDNAVSGWAVWQGKAALEITIANDTGILTTLIESDSFHAFADLGAAANFDLRRLKSIAPQSITLSIASEVIYSTRAPANETPPKRRPRLEPVNYAPAEPRPVAVVVPVFADFESLRACLESLLIAVADSDNHRITLVNDATPEPRIAEYLDELANEPSVLLLTNTQNLGFVGSVNRALEQLGDEDVILLNSDTIVPKDFAARLAEAAASAPDIGTVTPLSNNGEDASFPVANKANPLGTMDDVMAIDAIAATVNAGLIIDIPSGIGFCLYVTRECLDAVGFLSEDYYRGYVEDVDFCLRARAKGFRNICAPSVYVGHAGNKSFGQEKRALVVRNYSVLDRRYPTYHAETAAFDFADPLAPSRQVIERSLRPAAKRPRLLLTGAGFMASITAERARRITAEQASAMIVEVHHESAGPKAKLFDPAGGVPQSLQFDLTSSGELAAMIGYVRAVQPSGIEIIDPAHLPLGMVDGVLKLGVPHAMFIGDATLIADGRLRAAAIRLPRDAIGTMVNSPADNAAGDVTKRWQEIAVAADRILVPSEHAREFALNHFGESKLCRVEAVSYSDGKQLRRRLPRKISRLGLLPVRANGEEPGLIGAIAAALHSSNPAAAMTVVGATLDDLRLMQIGNVFVTGTVDPPDFNRVVRSYCLQALFLAATRPIFGHPIIELAFACGLPVAYFDWSMGRSKPKKGDLALDPAISFEDMITLLGSWMAKS
jgi:O-antigen biosynthesis protein